MREQHVQQQELQREISKHAFKQDDERVLHYGEPEPDALTLLTQFTLYPDLRMYWVRAEHFYGDDEEYVTTRDFKKLPIDDERPNIYVSRA